MKLIKFLFILFCIGTFSSTCSELNSDIGRYIDFPIAANVALESIELGDSVFMRYPYRMALSDSFLFILDLHPQEFFIHCFTYPSFSYYHSLCKRGAGPEEFISIQNIQCYNDTIFIFDSRNEIYMIDIHKLSDTNSAFGKIKLPVDYGFLSRGIRIKERFFFPVFNVLNDGRILVFDGVGNYLHAIGEIKSDNKREINAATCQAWMPFLAGNEKMLVAATQHGEVIDLFDADQHQYTIKGKNGDPLYQEIDTYAVMNGIVGFVDVVVKNKYIYAVFNGGKINEQDEKIQGGKYIYIFDYKGKPIKKIILDRHITCLYVVDDESIIYALDVNSDNSFYTAQLSVR
jgi:hypothetical protein